MSLYFKPKPFYDVNKRKIIKMKPIPIDRVEPDIGGLFCLFQLTKELNPYFKGTIADDLQNEIEMCINYHDDGMTKVLREYIIKDKKK
jgi:hypothetical protein